jgi:hypothetical protein
VIIRFNQVKTPVDNQIDEMQKSVIREVNSAIRQLDLAIRTMELNDCRPKLSYDHAREAKFILKNLVSDLKLDTRLK